MYKVMIVEDEDWLRESLQCYLTLEGHECRLAGNGAEALEVLEGETFDAVITDIMMPEMDGITMMRELAKRHFRTPVLVITGGGLIDSRAEAFHAGAQGFLEKPFSPVEFYAEFDRMMREHAPMFPAMPGLAHAVWTQIEPRRPHPPDGPSLKGIDSKTRSRTTSQPLQKSAFSG